MPNIQHITIEPFRSSTGALLGYEVTAHEGWYIHFNNGDEDLALIYDIYALININYDFSLLEIVSASDLPKGAIINGEAKE